jgi:hypothetical protein
MIDKQFIQEIKMELTNAATIEDIQRVHKKLIFALLQLRLNKLIGSSDES